MNTNCNLIVYNDVMKNSILCVHSKMCILCECNMTSTLRLTTMSLLFEEKSYKMNINFLTNQKKYFIKMQAEIIIANFLTIISS